MHILPSLRVGYAAERQHRSCRTIRRDNFGTQHETDPDPGSARRRHRL